ncbi:hypothetical protein SAMN02745117_00956 [Lampropedia hyalina DSM 16112]|jgi:hypothetical protein|uniref:Uncharacterized protein n=1 Tax=Lampropedia hyalina DSM 16112 TaxID=1122156 RepID=A0A1M4WZT7_9BURK|nr:hypothetical protein [Lampropedia hyalina]SHE86759.1 hypothetical protein SAMN02745117_00956 [Lampropedia hyalina DSM 16112]
MELVFGKTPKGQAEINDKLRGLTPRLRRILIFVDGKRTVDDLRSVLPSDDLEQTLSHLEEEGHIEVVKARHDAASATAPAVTESVALSTPFRVLPTVPDPQHQQQARNFMINTLRTFVGPVGISSLLERIDEARGHEELRALYDEWYRTLLNSRDGRREVDGLSSKLLLII